MMKKPGYRDFGRIAVTCLLLLVVASCESGDRHVGVYKAVGEPSKQGEIVLELKANGEGVWRVGSNEDSFVWYIKRGELRVNTKGGGVLVGTIKKDTIHLTLPGSIDMAFKKER